MNDDEQKKIFGKNLSYYVSMSGKDQKEIAKELGYAPTTFNTWCVGKIIPSMGKVQKIADYFGIGKSDLLDDRHSDKNIELDYEILTNDEYRFIIEKYKQLDNFGKENLKKYLEFLLSDNS